MSSIALEQPQSPQNKPQNRKSDRSPLRVVLLVMLGAAILVGSVVAVMVLLPDLTVYASTPVEERHPFSSIITVTNSGGVPLENVDYAIAVRRTSSAPQGATEREKFYGSLVIPATGAVRHYLGFKRAFSFPLNSIIEGDKSDTNTLDFAVLVRYDLPILHLHRQKLFPLKVTRLSNGSFYWFAEPEQQHYTLTNKGSYLAGTLDISQKEH